MLLARPAQRDSRSVLGRLQALLYRHLWIRWAAAAGAALIVLFALGPGGVAEAPEPAEAGPPATSSLLPLGTRGVPVPVDNALYRVGDSVDVHAVFDGAAVARSAPVIEAIDGEVVVAVPVEQVDDAVDALTTGGVILVLSPAPASG